VYLIEDCKRFVEAGTRKWGYCRKAGKDVLPEQDNFVWYRNTFLILLRRHLGPLELIHVRGQLLLVPANGLSLSRLVVPGGSSGGGKKLRSLKRPIDGAMVFLPSRLLVREGAGNPAWSTQGVAGSA